MNVALIAVGTEFLAAGRRDTNTEWLAERCERLGAGVRSRALVVDDEAVIVAALRAAHATARVVLLTGGLGPTEDDRTRPALATVLDAPLERDSGMERTIEGLFRARGRPFSSAQARQADRPRGSEWMLNPLGSAPGILVDRADTLLAAFPGVPGEMRAMFAADVEPRLARMVRENLARRTLKIAGRTESGVDQQLKDLYARPGVDATILASKTGIELHVRVRGPNREAARAGLTEFEAAVRERLGRDVFGTDDETLAEVVGRMLARRGRTVATAESCTGGLVGGAITEIPGSSGWYRGGFVAYANELKTRLVGVPSTLIAEHGAVSARVAEALAVGARERTGADYGIAVTGVAGPGGGLPGKPVGLVHIAVADARGVREARIHWTGERALVRARSVTAALDLLRRRLLEEDERP